METDVRVYRDKPKITHSSPYLKSYGNNEMFGDVRVLKTEATSCKLSSQLSMFWMKMINSKTHRIHFHHKWETRWADDHCAGLRVERSGLKTRLGH